MIIDFEKLLEDTAATRQMVQVLMERLNHLSATTTSTDDEAPLTIQQAAEFLNVSRQTIYQNIAKIPHRKRHGRLYFFKPELAEYLNRAV